MQVRSALTKRKSVRAFTEQAVGLATVERLIDLAGKAPSGTNAQPWQVAVVSGTAKQRLDEQLIAAHNRGDEEKMDYLYYPTEWVEPFLSRRRACGLQLYTTLQIKREDKARQFAQWQANYSAFGAPVALYFFLHPKMQTGSFVDYGMFLQSLMLAAVEEGLATCAQAALGQYPEIVKRELGYPDDSILICGMALGYEDSTAKVNSYRTPREAVGVYTRFFSD